LRWLCALGCSSFDFAEALAFCLSFFCSFCVGRVVFRVRHNVKVLGLQCEERALRQTRVIASTVN